jgi:hypothetical protein
MWDDPVLVCNCCAVRAGVLRIKTSKRRVKVREVRGVGPSVQCEGSRINNSYITIGSWHNALYGGR